MCLQKLEPKCGPLIDWPVSETTVSLQESVFYAWFCACLFWVVTHRALIGHIDVAQVENANKNTWNHDLSAGIWVLGALGSMRTLLGTFVCVCVFLLFVVVLFGYFVLFCCCSLVYLLLLLFISCCCYSYYCFLLLFLLMAYSSCCWLSVAVDCYWILLLLLLLCCCFCFLF